MATIKLNKGGENIAAKLAELSRAGEAIGKMATYEGAKVIADGIRESIESLPVDTPMMAPTEPNWGCLRKKTK